MCFFFFFSSRRRHTRCGRDWSSDVCSSDLGALIPKRHQRMLLSILDLEKITAEDIMVPRNEISGIDIDADWDEIVHLLQNSQHTRMPVYEGSIDKMLG